MKDPEIVPLTTRVFDTFNEDNEVDVPNLIPPDHEPDDKNMINDDDTCQVEDFQFHVPSILMNGKYDSDNECSDDECSDDEDSDLEDSDDDELQESAIQMDFE